MPRTQSNLTNRFGTAQNIGQEILSLLDFSVFVLLTNHIYVQGHVIITLALCLNRTLQFIPLSFHSFQSSYCNHFYAIAEGLRVQNVYLLKTIELKRQIV